LLVRHPLFSLSHTHLLTTRRMPRLTSMMITARDATIPIVSGICACSRPSHCAPRSGLQTAQGRAHAPALLPCYAQKMKISRDGNFAAVAKPRTSGVQHSLMLLPPASHPTGRLVTDWRKSLRETRREEQGAWWRRRGRKPFQGKCTTHKSFTHLEPFGDERALGGAVVLRLILLLRLVLPTS
jgi:hypothetical protein